MMTNQCPKCKHLFIGKLSCDAFPNGIPTEILSGNFDHTKEFKDDSGIRFES